MVLSPPKRRGVVGTVPLGASGEHSASHLTPGRASPPSPRLMSPPTAGCQHLLTHCSLGWALHFVLLCCLCFTAPVALSLYQREHPARLLDPEGEVSASVTAQSLRAHSAQRQGQGGTQVLFTLRMKEFPISVTRRLASVVFELPSNTHHLSPDPPS